MLIPSWINDDSEIPDPFGYGERAVQWLRRLKHPKNPARGHPFQLDPWQERIIRKLYGPRHEDGRRVVRRLTLVLPRGNRKTSLCGSITLLHLIGPERQPGNLVVSAASAHEQAMELFNEVAMIVQHDRRLEKHLAVREYTSSITFKAQRSRYIAVASDGKVQHGKTPNVVIADELHAWEGRAGRVQWEALDSALVKVPDTLMIVATTSGRGQENLAWKTIDYAIKVQKGEIDDPATLPVVFMAEEGDDWRDEAVWHALNPGMRHGYPDLTSYRDKAQKAINSPSDRDSFLQFNLNRWLDHSTSPFVEMSVYDQGADPVDLDELKGESCWLGVDLSSNSDLTAVVACWRDGDDGFQVYPWFFCPEDNLRRRADKDGVAYPAWAADRFIIPTPGNVVDFHAVENHKRIELMKVEAATIDESAAAQDRARVIVELETAAKQANERAGKKNAEVTVEQRTRIEALADAYAKARGELERLNSPLASFARESANVGQQLERLAVGSLDRIADDFGEIVTGTRTVEDAFKSMARSILAELAKIAIKQAVLGPLASLMGGGGGGSILSALIPKFADGTSSAPGGLAIVGERGPELVNLPRGSQVIPNHRLGSGGGDTITAPVTVTIDATGADAAGLRRVEQQVADLKVNLPGLTVQAIQSAKRRRVAGL